jgi:transposase
MLISVGPPGRAPKIDDDQLERIRHALLAGVWAHGFDQELWTLQRIAVVIQRVTGIRHHADTCGTSCATGCAQRPAREAVERNEDTVTTWIKHDWHRITKTPPPAERGSSSSTSPDCR